MTKEQLKRIFRKNVLLLGGLDVPSAGLEAYLEDAGASLAERMAQLTESGANILLAPTHAVQPQRRDSDEAAALTRSLVDLTRQAARDQAFVAGVITQDDVTVRPFGTMAFDDCVALFRAQAQTMLDAGVSLFVLEGFRDLFAARCAVLAIKDICTLPTLAALRFEPDDDGSYKLNYGTDPVAALVTLQSMGVDAVGCSCGDPDGCLDVLRMMRQFAVVPLLALPDFSAGAPDAEEYGEYLPEYVNSRCAAVGFCRSASADGRFTGTLAKALWQTAPFQPDFPILNAYSSYCDVIFMDFDGKPVGRDETMFLPLDKDCKNVDKIIETLVTKSTLPAYFEIDDEAVLERVLRLYPGRCGVNVPEDLAWLVTEYSTPIITIADIKRRQDIAEQDRQ